MKARYFLTQALYGIVLLALLAACSKSDAGTNQNTEAFVRLEINGKEELNVSGNPMESMGIHARISAQDIAGPDGDIYPKNTAGVTGANIIDQSAGKSQVLTINVPGITGIGEYDIIAQGGLLVYADSRNGIDHVKSWTVGEDAEQSSGTFTVTEISAVEIPGLGKAITGTFTVTAEDLNGDTATLTGTFSGG